MAGQSTALMPNKTTWKKAIDPYINELRKRKVLNYTTFPFAPGQQYSVDKIVVLLEDVRDTDLSKELTDAVTNKNLTIDRLLDLSIRWVMAMTIVESIHKGEPFKLKMREAFRTWEFLWGQRDTFVALFPLAYFYFHQTPMSIESIVASTPKAEFPLQVATSSIHHVAENEDMRPIETFLHDVFHAIQRMRQYFQWLFPDNPEFYFPKTYSIAVGFRVKNLKITIEEIRNSARIRQEQEDFHHFIFTTYDRYPDNVKAGIELVWFKLFFSDRQTATNTSMSPAGVITMSPSIISNIEDTANLARSGGLGARYLKVDEACLINSIRALNEMANEYMPAGAK
jgi:hypothetical protein